MNGKELAAGEVRLKAWSRSPVKVHNSSKSDYPENKDLVIICPVYPSVSLWTRLTYDSFLESLHN